MDHGAPLIQLSGVDVRHHEHVVLSDIHLEVRPGELVYLVGRTGSGKSSLLRTLYGDLSLSSGEGRVCEVDLTKVRATSMSCAANWAWFQDTGC